MGPDLVSYDEDEHDIKQIYYNVLFKWGRIIIFGGHGTAVPKLSELSIKCRHITVTS
jgi:hypothetical protein